VSAHGTLCEARAHSVRVTPGSSRQHVRDGLRQREYLQSVCRGDRGGACVGRVSRGPSAGVIRPVSAAYVMLRDGAEYHDLGHQYFPTATALTMRRRRTMEKHPQRVQRGGDSHLCNNSSDSKARPQISAVPPCGREDWAWDCFGKACGSGSERRREAQPDRTRLPVRQAGPERRPKPGRGDLTTVQRRPTMTSAAVASATIPHALAG
jgi:hypothetical protein